MSVVCSLQYVGAGYMITTHSYSPVPSPQHRYLESHLPHSKTSPPEAHSSLVHHLSMPTFTLWHSKRHPSNVFLLHFHNATHMRSLLSGTASCPSQNSFPFSPPHHTLLSVLPHKTCTQSFFFFVTPSPQYTHSITVILLMGRLLKMLLRTSTASKHRPY